MKASFAFALADTQASRAMAAWANSSSASTQHFNHRFGRTRIAAVSFCLGGSRRVVLEDLPMHTHTAGVHCDTGLIGRTLIQHKESVRGDTLECAGGAFHGVRRMMSRPFRARRGAVSAGDPLLQGARVQITGYARHLASDLKEDDGRNGVDRVARGQLSRVWPGLASFSPSPAPISGSLVPQSKYRQQCNTTLGRFVDGVFANPLSESVFLELASRQFQHCGRRLGLGNHETIAVQREEQAHRKKRGPLVAINKWVVLGKTVTVARGEVRMVRGAIHFQIARTCQSRIQ